MSYVDGYLLVVPKKNVNAYKKLAQWGKTTWMKHGAVAYLESVGDDLKTKFGVPFTKTMKTKSSETVVFAYIVFKSRAHRDKVNKRVMDEIKASMKDNPQDMPCDMDRMVYGGFKAIVES